MDWDFIYRMALILVSCLPGIAGIFVMCTIIAGARKDMEKDD